MRYFHALKLFFLWLLAAWLIASCSHKSDADFSKIILQQWYAGEINGEKWFFKFQSATNKTAEGIAFHDKNQSMLSPGKVSIGNDFLKINFENSSETIDGKWNISGFDLIFIKKKEGRQKTVFKLQPTFTLPATKKRYLNNIAKKVSRKEVKYGSVRGFYTSKKVKDMNAESYPQIISDVLSELGNNLLTTELSLMLDIYEPQNDSATSRPLLLLIHGGAFIVGDKRDSFQQKLAIHYAKRGYVVASINYRLGYLFIPGAYSNLERCIYRAVQDSRAALRYLVKHKNKYRIDPDHIFIAGNSAGGFIALKTAFMAESESYKSIEGNLLMLQEDLGCIDCSGNYFKEKYRLKGVINMWGALTDIEMMDEFEQMPLLLIHGDSDAIVPYGHSYPFSNVGEQYSAFFSNKVYGSEPIFKKASAMGFPVSLLTIPGGGHEPQFDEHNNYTQDLSLITAAIDSFLYAQLTINTFRIEKQTQNIFAITPVTNVDKVYWNITGGCITDIAAKNKVRMVRFSDAEKCVLKAVVLNKNGLSQYIEINID
ncbi:MAG TPA: alpha/beta hydrolase [Bacteroidales bacterium]|nr:alpha/beta hydrolase [Bacteroidales bacterium]